jgi:MscS family membrane protein
LVDQVRSNPLTAQNPEPRVRFREFGDSSLDFELLCWARRPHDRGRLMHDLNTSIYNDFADAGIEIPFPQRDVHLKHAQECKG